MILIILLLNFFFINCSTVALHPTIKTKKISPNFDKKGYPDTRTIKSLITAQYLQQIQQNKISVKQIKGGLYSERMYVATTKKNGKKTPLLFFKISKKSDSTEKLIKIQEVPIKKKF